MQQYSATGSRSSSSLIRSRSSSLPPAEHDYDNDDDAPRIPSSETGGSPTAGRGGSSRKARRSATGGTATATAATTTRHRVLLYTTCYNVLDGVTLTVRKLEQEILNAGHSVCVLTTASGNPSNTDLVPPHPNRKVIFLDNSSPIPFLSSGDPSSSYELGFSLSRKMKRLLDEYKPSIVHLTCPDCTALHLVQYARRNELPILGTYHSNIPEYMEHYPGLSWLKHVLAAFLKHQYSFLQALYVPTPYIQNYLSDQYQMDRATAVKVWGHGVDVNKFHPSNRSDVFRRRFVAGGADEPVILLWVSRLVPEKRPDIFSNVVRRLASRGCNFHAIVVGAGPAEDEVKQLPNTTFCGWMNEDQLSVAYASSDVFLFPSSVETFGLVTLEASASGLPVVVEEGCSGHLVRHGDSGYACPEADEDAFFRATYELVTNHEKRKRFSRSSRQLSLQWEKRAIVRRMLDNYAAVTEEFYADFGGRHANRDSIFRNRPGAFKAGSHPRPLLLILVEWIFVTLFNAMFTFTSIFMFVQRFSMFRRDTGTWSPSIEGKEQRVHHHATSSPSGTVVIVKENKTFTCGRDLSLIENYYESDDDAAAVAEDDMIAPIIPQDDSSGSSDSTVSAATTQDEMTVSSGGASGPSESQSPRSESSTSRRISHGLARFFVRSVLFQCRIESEIRNVLFGTGRFLNNTRPAKHNNSSAGAIPTSSSVTDSQLLRRRTLRSRASENNGAKD